MSDSERKIGDLTVHIDRDTCIGSGNCVNVGGTEMATILPVRDRGRVLFFSMTLCRLSTS